MYQSLYSIKAYFRKEFIEGIRTHKFIIMALGILFFSIADPVILRFTPAILSSQAPGIDLTGYFELSQKAALESYANTLYQISTFIIVYTLMGLMAGERTEKTLCIPISMGCRVSGIVLSKLLVYGIVLTMLSVTGMTIAYFYAGMTFEMGPVTYGTIARAGLIYGCYYLFIISIITLMNSLVQKPYVAGITTLLIAYALPVLHHFNGIARFLPSMLLKEASLFNGHFHGEIWTTLISTLVIIILLNTIAVFRFKRISYT